MCAEKAHLFKHACRFSHNPWYLTCAEIKVGRFTNIAHITKMCDSLNLKQWSGGKKQALKHLDYQPQDSNVVIHEQKQNIRCKEKK